MEKVALLVVYNHRYDKNISTVENLYEGKFSHVYHLIPFYDGDKENVIPVYENSYHFQGYIAQAFTHIKRMGFTHYFVVADDMILNPAINETNLWSLMGIGKDECFIRDLREMQKEPFLWVHLPNALNYKVKQKGVEIGNSLPSVEEARARFAFHNISTDKIPVKTMIPKAFGRIRTKKFIQCLLTSRRFSYPLLRAYSDIFLVPDDVMPKFCSYLGAFSATKLFVETAIPTAMVLSADKIKCIKDIKMEAGDIWGEEINQLGEKYKYSVNKLIENYPKNIVYYHPIKLSKWKLQ